MLIPIFTNMEFSMPIVSVLTEEDNLQESFNEMFQSGFIPLFIRNNKEINKKWERKISGDTGKKTKVFGVIFSLKYDKTFLA